jgi:hypothetical protein
MKNRKTPLECCQTLPMVSILEEIRGACKKDRQREGKVFSYPPFRPGVEEHEQRCFL